MEKAHELLAAVTRRILLPSVTGGALEIGPPFGDKRARLAGSAVGDEESDRSTGSELHGESRGHASVRELLGGGVLDATEEAVLRRVRRLAPTDASALGPRLDASTVELAALFHDCVAAFHPDISGVFRRSAPRRLLEASIASLVATPGPATVRGALLRHAWLGGLVHFELRRTDLRWWTGSASFIGRAPPARLLAWPDLRRVQRDDRRVELLHLPELFGERGDAGLAELHARAMSAFLAATPLTDLVLAARASPPLVWTAALASLVDLPAGARIARRALALADDGGRHALEAIATAAGGVPDGLRAIVA